MPSLMSATLKLISKPRRLSASRKCVSNCFLWTGAIASTDLISTITLSSTNRDLRHNLAALRGQPIEQFTQGRMTYQLRRLRLHGLIERIPKTHRYRLTTFGFRVAVFCTRAYARILRPGLGLALPSTSSLPCPLRRTFDKLEKEIASWVEQAKLAA